jgi:antitoxin (DNA-binding transcriptional repressor) of toxin-antitoxin stability system
MSKEITVEELIANIAEHVAEVKNGETLTVVEGGETVFTITPRIVQRGMRYPFRDLKISPGPERLSIDSTTLIREDRDSEFKKHGF